MIQPKLDSAIKLYSLMLQLESTVYGSHCPETPVAEEEKTKAAGMCATYSTFLRLISSLALSSPDPQGDHRTQRKQEIDEMLDQVGGAVYVPRLVG